MLWACSAQPGTTREHDAMSKHGDRTLAHIVGGHVIATGK
jgi:hypothetical protein